MDAKLYNGTSYARTLREFQWFDKSPTQMSPVEIIEWAITCGQWSLAETSGGTLTWRGPWGSPPFPGSEIANFPLREVALQCMRTQYETWYAQKTLVQEAFGALHKETLRAQRAEEEEDEE